jgi:hypothetical protein
MTKKSNKTVIPVEPEDWCERMVQKYPNVLWEPDAVDISGLPDGWQNTVEDLLRTIDTYTSTPRFVCDNSYAFKFKKTYNSVMRKTFRKIKPYLGSRISFITHKLIFPSCLSVNKHYVEKTPNAVTIFQIKEKFASLRVYYSGGDDNVKGMVTMAENICSITCQSSGSRGGVYTNIAGWVSILDPKIAKKIKKNRGL